MYFFIIIIYILPSIPQNRLGATLDEKMTQVYKHYHRDQREYKYNRKISLKFANLSFSADSKPNWQGVSPDRPFIAILCTWQSFSSIFEHPMEIYFLSECRHHLHREFLNWSSKYTFQPFSNMLLLEFMTNLLTIFFSLFFLSVFQQSIFKILNVYKGELEFFFSKYSISE